MRFIKMHACASDYILVDGRQKLTNPPRMAAVLSDRRLSVGGDGLAVVSPSEVADCRMRVFLRDGTESEMDASALMCAAAFAKAERIHNKDTVTVETASGIKEVELMPGGGTCRSARVNLGAPILYSGSVPVLYRKERVVDEPIEAGGQIFRLTCVSVGDPHCVSFVRDLKNTDVVKFGALLERLPIFPKKISADFCEIESPQVLHLRVFARGAGEIPSSGSGACAAAVAARLLGLTGDKVRVLSAGGEFGVDYSDGVIRLAGAVDTVFAGEVPDTF